MENLTTKFSSLDPKLFFSDINKIFEKYKIDDLSITSIEFTMNKLTLSCGPGKIKRCNYDSDGKLRCRCVKKK